MKQRKWLMTLTATLVVLVLAACSSNNASNGKKDESSAKSATAKKNVNILMTFNAAVENFKDGMDVNKNPIINFHKEQSGIDVQTEVLPKDNVIQKISMVLSSGDVPDLITIQTGKSDMFRLAKQGAFMPLDDLIEKAPNYLKLVSEEELEAAKVDGVLYALPYPQTAPYNRAVIIRQDILDELGLQEPVTLDEYVDVFRTIKEKKGIIPLTAAASASGELDYSLTPFAGAFGVASTTVVKDGKLEFSCVQPEYKEYLTFLKTLYDEGLLDKEFSVLKTSNIQEKLISGQAAAGVSDWAAAKTIAETLTAKDANAKTVFLDLPVGPDGQSGMIQDVPIVRYSVIPKGAKNPEAMLEYLNYMSSEEALKVQDYGLEGENYTVENGKIVQSLEQNTAVNWRVLYQLMDTPEHFMARLSGKGFTPYYEPLTTQKLIREETEYAPPVDEYDKIISSLKAFKDEIVTKFILGSRDLSEFDQFVEEFNARGGRAAIDAMNEEYYLKK